MSDPSSIDYRHFHDKIRSYNAAIAMASLGANHCGPIQGRGPFCFKIMGQIYHSTSNLYPPNSQDQRSFGQLYIFDGQEAVEHRLRLAPNRKCKEYILSKLVDKMVNINPHAQSFRLLHSLVQGQTNLPEIIIINCSSSSSLFLCYFDRKKIIKRKNIEKMNLINEKKCFNSFRSI